MKEAVFIDTRLKSKIEYLTNCSVRFKDMDDTFWFETYEELQEFLSKQSVERFYDKELRKGYFDYINENGETFRYFIEVFRGKITSVREEYLEILN